jgi:hypothetical protein
MKGPMTSGTLHPPEIARRVFPRPFAAIGVYPRQRLPMVTAVTSTDGNDRSKRNQLFGMALLGDSFYVGNTDGVVAFPCKTGARRITRPGNAGHLQARRALDVKPAVASGRAEAVCWARAAQRREDGLGGRRPVFRG